MTEQDREEFAALLEAWATAIVANDPDAIDEFVEPEWIMIGEGGIFPREQFLESVASGNVTHDTMSFEVHEVRIYGEVAVVTVRGRNDGAYLGSPFALDEWTTDVFVRSGASWKCVLTHLTTALEDG